MASDLTSTEAMRMFGVFADAFAAKPDRRSVTERVMEMIAELHEQGFEVVRVGAPQPTVGERRRIRVDEQIDG
jgi:predicted amino acid dehydrogenase